MVGYSDPRGKERKHVFGQSSIVVLFKVTVKFVYFFFFFPQQLHSSVRTGNLETCLRLLTLGAQANFFHPVRPSVFKSIISVFLHVFFFLSNSGSCSGFCYVDHCLGQEKGSTPLHVAAKAGQVSQVELLTVYGADPGAPDSRGKTPIDCARQAYVFII